MTKWKGTEAEAAKLVQLSGGYMSAAQGADLIRRAQAVAVRRLGARIHERPQEALWLLTKLDEYADAIERGEVTI